jgi:hypothetical protein
MQEDNQKQIQSLVFLHKDGNFNCQHSLTIDGNLGL